MGGVAVVRGTLAAALLTAVLVVAVVAAVRIGDVPLSTGEVVRAVAGTGDAAHRIIVVDFRLPRSLLAVLIGGGLAIAGATYQALLRNPLAEPYILGISGGSAVGAVLVLAVGLTVVGSWVLPLAAFGGALLAIALVFGVASAADRRLDVRVLLLAGVVVGAFFTAVMAFVLSISEADAVKAIVIWTMGSLASATWGDVGIVAAYTLPTTVALVALARPLNLLAVGEETAAYLGTDVEAIKRSAYAVASLLTAAGVAFAGVIGFVGLIVPHAVRLVVGADYRVLLPLSFLAGGAFLAFADLVAKTALSPAEIPIGVITALVGVPFFLVLLRWSLRR